MDIARNTVVCDIKVVGHCRIFRCKGVNLLDNRQNAELLAERTDVHAGLLDAHGIFHSQSPCHLEVAESLLFG